MKTKLSLGLIVFFFLIVSANALPNIQMIPNTISASGMRGQLINRTINITNTGNVTLWNMSISPVNNLTWINIPNRILPSETKQLTAEVRVDTINSNPLIQFYYYFNTTYSQRTWNVTMGYNTYNPINLNIHKNDTIQWINNVPNESKTATKTDFSFDLTAPVNGTTSKLFTNTGFINYFNKIGINYAGTINVTSNNQPSFVHNGGLDKFLPVSIISSTAMTTTSLNIFLNSLSIKYNEAIANALTITNTGNFTAVNVFLKGKWSNFNQTVYQIAPQQVKFIQFNTIPLITQTSQTNATYNIDINVSGSNIPTVTKSMNVFIKYHQFNGSGSNSSANVQVIYIKNETLLAQLCKSTPGFCPTVYQNQTIYADIPHKVNLTTGLVEQAFTNYANWSSTMDRFTNRMESDMLKITEALNAMKDELHNQSLEIQILRKQDAETNQLWRDVKVTNFYWNIAKWILWIIVIIIGVICFFAWRSYVKRFYTGSIGDGTA